jgi:hypothetical protein
MSCTDVKANLSQHFDRSTATSRDIAILVMQLYVVTWMLASAVTSIFTVLAVVRKSLIDYSIDVDGSQ